MFTAGTRRTLAACLADAFLAGEWTVEAALDRAGEVLDRRPRWIGPLARDVFASYHRAPLDRPRELARFIELALERRGAGGRPPQVRRWLVAEPAMGRARWPVPRLASVGALAEFLELEIGELSWFADIRGLERSVVDLPLRHYTYAVLPREPGRVPRVIERPKRRLKQLQRRLLHDLLDWVPAHDAAHGFTRGRSVITHVAAHTGKHVVLRMDLEDFFASVPAGRVFAILRTAGYPEAVAHTLTGLMTNSVPATVWERLPHPHQMDAVAKHHRFGRRLAQPHLPQGAPTSPALANLAAFRLDRRLAGAAAALGLDYTRYADDLVFSGPSHLAAVADGLRAQVAAIAADEGLRVNQEKSTLATRAGRQRVCGVVVNEHPNIAREEYDALKAIIHNCARQGPASQNRNGINNFRAHLVGRIAWVETLNPQRGRKLRRALSDVPWD
ncbi:MAG: reverse transcriptase family protein [Solirubrobacteraceae bacterium]